MGGPCRRVSDGSLRPTGALPDIWNWPALLIVLAAVPAADFVSGMIHWTFDTWGCERTFWIGPRLIRQFRGHHTKPKDLLGSHFLTTNSDSAVASLPFLLLAFCIPLGSEIGQLISLALVAVGVCFLPTNQIHKSAHAKRRPFWVTWLQRCRLILSPVHHDAHHAEPHTTNYCITTGWCNPFLTSIGFFTKLEWLVSAITGWKPRAAHRSAQAV